MADDNPLPFVDANSFEFLRAQWLQQVPMVQLQIPVAPAQWAAAAAFNAQQQAAMQAHLEELVKAQLEDQARRARVEAALNAHEQGVAAIDNVNGRAQAVLALAQRVQAYREGDDLEAIVRGDDDVNDEDEDPGEVLLLQYQAQLAHIPFIVDANGEGAEAEAEDVNVEADGVAAPAQPANTPDAQEAQGEEAREGEGNEDTSGTASNTSAAQSSSSSSLTVIAQRKERAAGDRSHLLFRPAPSTQGGEQSRFIVDQRNQVVLTLTRAICPCWIDSDSMRREDVGYFIELAWKLEGEIFEKSERKPEQYLDLLNSRLTKIGKVRRALQAVEGTAYDNKVWDEKLRELYQRE